MYQRFDIRGETGTLKGDKKKSVEKQILMLILNSKYINRLYYRNIIANKIRFFFNYSQWEKISFFKCRH